MKRLTYTAILLLAVIFFYQCEKKEKEKDTSFHAGTLVDPRDGQMYEWAVIGDQLWMAENLNYDQSS
jgi:hypothetical protein